MKGIDILKKACNRIWLGLVWLVCALLPVDDRKVVFCSFYGRGYGGNPMYIADAMLESGRPYKMIWLIQNERDMQTIPDGIIPCKRSSAKGIYHLVTAKVWVDDCRKYYIFKRKKQYYIQTWHGFALKQIEKDVQDKLHWKYIANARRDSKDIDLIVSNSSFMTKIYRKSFWYHGEIAQWGDPRNDCLLINEQRGKCRGKVNQVYCIPEEKKILLYAPTFRGDKSLEPYKIDLERVKRACEKRFSDGFIVLVRLHPNIADKSKELAFCWNEHVIDATQYPDIQELLSASDVVISDYSSLMFDFALTGKPCFQFATDIEMYKQDRNFYFPLEQLPFALAENNDELELQMLGFQWETYRKNLDQFFDFVGMVRMGGASKICAEHIRDICFPEKEA